MARNRTIPFGYMMQNGEITAKDKFVIMSDDDFEKAKSAKDKTISAFGFEYSINSKKWNARTVESCRKCTLRSVEWRYQAVW